MFAVATLLSLFAVDAGTAPVATENQAEPAPAVEPPAPPPPPEPPPRRPRRYADRGTMEIGLGAGYSSRIGFLGAGAFRYFVVDGVAPGVEVTYVSGGSNVPSYGLVLGALKVVPLRTGSFALVLTGRAGRMLMSDHGDGWAAGGGAGVLLLFTPTAGLELGYEALRLLPGGFCADLSTCVLHGPVIGIRFGF
jgi:hypothetical protein